MLVYADREREISPAQYLSAIAASIGESDRESLTNAFVMATELAQGLVDAEFAAAGVDDWTPIHRASVALLLDIAQRLHRPNLEPFKASLVGLEWPAAVQARTAEGFAHYAVYPEAFLAAGERVEAGTVIGLRSIGAGLGALVAVACGAERLFSVRPIGDPFRRRLAIASELETALLREPGAFAVVDEGPGRSGSSLASVAQWLIARGVPAQRIIFVTSHRGEPGPAADGASRALWGSIRRVSIDFDELFLARNARAPLASWFEDLTGPVLSSLQDISGGRWREGRRDTPPTHPMQERRKFKMQTRAGCFLMKYAGLGPDAHGKFKRARALHAAGFSTEPIALRRGVLLERWLDGAPAMPNSGADVARIGAYLGFRAERFCAQKVGASLAGLAAMAEQNIGEALGHAAGRMALSSFPIHRLDALQSEVRPVFLDGRLHLWEWLRIDGRLLKTDALDHCEGHDLVGPQDIAWDVAGAAVEFDLDAVGVRRLLDAMPPATRPSTELVAFMRVCYLGFQLGLWSFAAPQDDKVAALLVRYRALLT